MQTFLPLGASFLDGARCLDRARLGKQRAETIQVLKAISNKNYGWQNHPAVNMWRGYSNALVEYGLCVCKAWKERGYKDTCELKISSFKKGETIELPWWIEDCEYADRVSSSHRAALLLKKPEHYSQFGWIEEPEWNYFWPV